jgi:DHA3 family macrolide efflux protein-like MFS transporter
VETKPENPAIPLNWAQRFFTVWTGQAFSLFGSTLVQFTLIWYLTKSTGSATVLATATLLGLLPNIFFSPIAGIWIDRWNRRLVMILSDSLIALATLILIILFATGWIQVWHIYVILLIRAVGGAFHYPSLQASTSLMVPKDQLPRIAGLNHTLAGINNIVAPPLGALLLGLLPMQKVLLIDIGTAALAVGILLFTSIPQPVRKMNESGNTRKTTFWQDLGEGFTYIIHWPGLMAIILMAVSINFLLAPMNSFMPLMVTRIFNGGALQLGWSDSLFGVGVIIGGIVLTAWGGFKKRIITTLVGIMGIGVAVIIAGSAPSSLYPMFLAGFFILGFTEVITNGPLIAILQSNVDPEKQGRVMTLMSSGASGMSPLSLLVAASVADRLGIRVWYIGGGFLCVGMAAAALLIKPLMEIKKNCRPSPAGTEKRVSLQETENGFDGGEI